jgi:hypothetical protein
MSGRIRSIKPEILEDEKTARLSDREWRLFVSMFSLADDYGNLRGSAEWISGQTLWAFGMPVISSELEHIEELGLVESYDVAGQRYLHITNWGKHQKVDNPGKPRVPRPGGVHDVGTDGDGQALTYIARRGDDGPIKIGFSIDPEARAEQLSKCQPEKVRILATIAGRKHEKALHRKFAHLRIAGTEWFESHDDILSLVAELSNGCPMPGHGAGTDGQCPNTDGHGRAMPRARAQDPDPDRRTPTADPPGGSACPDDLTLDERQVATLSVTPGIPPDVLSVMVSDLVGRWVLDKAKTMPSRTRWAQALRSSVLTEWSNPERRRRAIDAAKPTEDSPPRRTDAEEYWEGPDA